jgi:exodeoxyribonuclease VII large subunit
MDEQLKNILNVSELNENIKCLFEEAFDYLWVEGEVSNLRKPQSGHIYFTLKDDKSQIRAVVFKQFGSWQRKRAGFDLEEGMKVLCQARLSVYPPRGEYQLIVESIEPRGAGALQKAFEQLKARLAQEGLFDERHKKPIPFLPQKIGVITSSTGAVIRDILNITGRRFPSVGILIAPVRVQGAEAAGEIIQGLRNLHEYGNVDVIIIARGGGSLEDLAPFNDEALAREIFRSEIPVISAVGHETDFTICDFVADLRAPTPSVAAELAVPERKELLAQTDNLRQRLINGYNRYLAESRDHLCGLQDRLKDPRRILIDRRIYLDDLQERIGMSLRHENKHWLDKIQKLELSLHHQSPAYRIKENKFLLSNIQKSIIDCLNGQLNFRKEKLLKNSAMLDSLSPLNVLHRGYSITQKFMTKDIIRQADSLQTGERVNIRLARGSLQAQVEKIFQE